VRGKATGSSAVQGEGLYWRYEDVIKRLESVVDSTTGVSGEMIAIRRKDFAPFPPDTINDDAALALAAMRRGQRVIYEPTAQCWEAGSSSLADDLVRRARMSAGRWQLVCAGDKLPWRRPLALWMYLSHKVLRLLLPLLMIGGLIANLAVCTLPEHTPALDAVLVLQLGAIAGCLLGAASDRFGLGWRPAQLGWYFMLGHWGSLVGLARFVAGGQSPTWQMASRRNLPEAGTGA
jgi:hypothetical protein